MVCLEISDRFTDSSSFLFFGVHFQNFGSTVHLGQTHNNLSVEPSRSEQSVVQYIDTIRGPDDDDVGLGAKPVHLG